MGEKQEGGLGEVEAEEGRDNKIFINIIMDYLNQDPRQIAETQLKDWMERERPLDMPELPLVITETFPETAESHDTNPACPVFSANMLGAQPDYRFSAPPPLASIPEMANNLATLPCASVNKQVYHEFAPMQDRENTNEFLNDEGVQHGDGVGIYSEPIHPVDNPLLAQPAPFWAYKQNWIPTKPL